METMLQVIIVFGVDSYARDTAIASSGPSPPPATKYPCPSKPRTTKRSRPLLDNHSRPCMEVATRPRWAHQHMAAIRVPGPIDHLTDPLSHRLALAQDPFSWKTIAIGWAVPTVRPIERQPREGRSTGRNRRGPTQVILRISPSIYPRPTFLGFHLFGSYLEVSSLRPILPLHNPV